MPLLRSTHLNLTEKFASVLELTMPPMVLILVDYLCVVTADLLVLLGTQHSAGLTAFLIGSSFLMSLALMVHAICPFLVFQLSLELFVELALPPRLRSLEAPGDVQRTADAVGFARPVRSPSSPEPVLATSLRPRQPGRLVQIQSPPVPGWASPKGDFLAGRNLALCCNSTRT